MTLDANIIIGYLDGDEEIIKALRHWQERGYTFFLSAVAEAEILSFSEWTPIEQRVTEEFLEENFTSISFDRYLARIAAQIRRNSKIKFPDAAIAATAIFTRSPLVTRNIKDFKKVSGLEIITI